jgi:transcriptional regulator with XRE-family HTH domain
MASDKYEHPELSRALTWLRLRARLTQDQVARKVTASGESLAASYYSELERGEIKRKDKKGQQLSRPVYPSTQKLDAILTALGSDRTELEGLLASTPWQLSPPSRARSLKNSMVMDKSFSLSGPELSSEYADYEPKVRGEVSQISDIYANKLSRTDQLTILKMFERLNSKYSSDA